MTIKLSELLANNGFDKKDLMEKVHICIGLIDNICHEIVYHKHEGLNYNIMIDLVISSILKLLM